MKDLHELGLAIVETMRHRPRVVDNRAEDKRINRLLATHGVKRANDLPLTARIIREKRGQYIAIISFAQSKRHYHDELVYASTIAEVKAHIRKLYPTLKFKKG